MDMRQAIQIVEGIKLRDGRDIYPMPKDERWMPVGEPVDLPIETLDLNPYGLAIASSAVRSGGSHQNSKPVSVAYVDGLPHVLDGYHRIVQAAKNGEEIILAQIME